MSIDRFIAWFVAKNSSRCFTFEEGSPVRPPSAPLRPIQLYIHIPFCMQLCPYCSFHRYLFEEGAVRAYFRALKTELRIYAGLGFRFSSVYMGGGTPTIVMEELFGVLELIDDLFSPEEVSVETNPDRLDRDTLSSLARAGVKRVSVGIQSFHDDILKAIGRYEKYGSGSVLAERLEEVRGTVDTLNVDMIYNFPIQDRSMLEYDLKTLHRILPDQITFYPLMISSATRKRMEGIMGRMSPGKERLFYRTITSSLTSIYEPNSAWCFSRAGSPMIDEYIVGGEEYVGAGSGAFGLVGGAIYANTFSLAEYQQALDAATLPMKSYKAFSRKDMARYSFLMSLFGLRLDVDAFKKRFGSSLWRLLGPECVFFLLIGALRLNGSTFELTERGRYYWVVMMREFFTGVDNFRDMSRIAAGL
ncbi:MAG: coproporphyrinogen III oxidase family protein [Deltaproteobacteria bacterium]|nr:coproporphyrinogen III oxidase family protein [Deltaproteobacteria bacterium]